MELELKFDVAEAEAWRLLEGLTPIGRPSDRTQRTVYFDTPDGLLHRHGLVLRIRDDGAGRVQAVKSRAQGGGFRRGEWETRVAGFEPDFEACARTPLAKVWTRADRDALAPLFEVRVKRARRLVAFGGAKVEIVFDRGEVVLNGAASPIRELELELKAGDPGALFDLARELSATARLDLSFTGKAERGYALADQAAAAPALAVEPEIDAKTSVGDAFGAIAMAALAQMAAGARALQVDKPQPQPRAKALHQLRVAVRRLRSAIGVFGPTLKDGGRDAVKAELKWLSGELNDARNLDVFIDESFAPAARQRPEAPGLDALGDVLAGRREQARARAAAAVDSPRFRRLMLETARWVELGAWRRGPEPERAALRDRPVREAAREWLSGRRHKLVKGGRRLDRLSPETRHRLRIRTKTLRYAAEFFAPLYAGDKAKAHARAARRLARLQEALGVLNDIAAAREMAADLATAPSRAAAPDAWRSYAAGLVVGERQAGEARALARACKAYRKVRAGLGLDWWR